MISRPLRVVHIITSLTTGGAERHVESLLGLSRHDESVICLYEEGLVGDAIAASGTTVELLGMAGWRKALAIPRLARMVRRHHPDVVHVHLLAAQLWGIPAARLAKVPIIVSTEHSIMATTIEGRRKSNWLRRLYLTLQAMTTRTVAVSTASASRLREWGVPDGDVEVIELGVSFSSLRFEPAARAAVRDELGIAEDARVIAAVGRLEPVKRFDTMLAALAPLLQPGETELILIGDGGCRIALIKQAHDLGVTGAVRFLGPRPDVARLLSAADLLLSPSQDETFGLAVVEGLAAGLPVVYAQCPAVEVLATRPAAARVLATSLDRNSEVAEIRHALLGVEFGSGIRHEPPPELSSRYDVGTRAAALDELYVTLASNRESHAAGRVSPKSGRRKRRQSQRTQSVPER